MTPQSHFMVVAPLDGDRDSDLLKLLASMNHRSGVVNPQNTLVPFGQFQNLHFARFVILDDPTLGDISVHGLARPDLPRSLAFLGDCDGPADAFLDDLVNRAGAGLRQIFSHCRGFTSNCDLLRWMHTHEQPPATMYVNWVGRTVQQIHQENNLREALENYLDANPGLDTRTPREIWTQLKAFFQAEQQLGRITLTPPEPTPLSWKVKQFLHALSLPLIALLLSPLLLLYAPIFIWQLRRRECTDPEVIPRPNALHAQKLAELEDHDVTNQFTAMGSLKPGRFRRWLLSVILGAVNYSTRHVYHRGRLTRVNTIHFARWVFLDQKQRLFFASNYDGSLEAYMDDFINKVGWGLNVVFSNGVGYPRTNWLAFGGAQHEQKFKYFIRRHQLATEVWYNAHPGLTAVDLERNSRIRQGIEKNAMSDREIAQWLQLL